MICNYLTFCCCPPIWLANMHCYENNNIFVGKYLMQHLYKFIMCSQILPASWQCPQNRYFAEQFGRVILIYHIIGFPCCHDAPFRGERSYWLSRMRRFFLSFSTIYWEFFFLETETATRMDCGLFCLGQDGTRMISPNVTYCVTME